MGRRAIWSGPRYSSGKLWGRETTRASRGTKPEILSNESSGTSKAEGQGVARKSRVRKWSWSRERSGLIREVVD